jgi:MFS family permease
VQPRSGHTERVTRVAGLALGAFPPLMIAYLTDLLPARQRGTLTVAVVGIGYLSPPGPYSCCVS